MREQVTRFALQHKTSKRFLALPPAVGLHAEHPDEEHAYPFDSQAEAEVAHLSLEAFAGAWHIVEIRRMVHRMPPDVG